MTRFLTAAMFTTLAAAAPAADPSAKVGDAPPPDELTAAVREVLDPAPVVVADADGEPTATVWFRKRLPARATAEQVRNGLTYRELPDGVLLGAVRFDRAFTDYRKQSIPAGVYTLRFAVQPDVGDHAGTSPHPEFALLVPADKDAAPEPVEPKDLLKLSGGATGGDHPAVMLLFPHHGKGDGPTVAKKDDGATVLLVRRPAEADGVKTTLGVGLTIAGHSKSR